MRMSCDLTQSAGSSRAFSPPNLNDMALSLGHRPGTSVDGRFLRAFGENGDGLLRGVRRFWRRLISGGRIGPRSRSTFRFR